ncbi:MAG: protein translocase subunit SecD [Ilumatobacteraceae bacterium]
MVRRLLVTLIGIVVVVAGLLVANLVAGNTPSLGLDLQGGASVTLQPEGKFDAAALDVAVEIIRARVDSIGVAEPEIIRQGDTVVVNLPGVDDQQRALDIVGRQGELLLRPVIQAGLLQVETTTTIAGTETTIAGSDTTLPASGGGPGGTRRVAATSVPTTVAPTTTSTSTSVAATTTVAPVTTIPAGDPNDPNATVLLTDGKGTGYYVGPAAASGKVFNNDAKAEIQNGSWVVVVGLRNGADGDQLWNALTTLCYNRDPSCPTAQVAIVLDGIVISAPVVREPVFSGGSVQISGSFKESEARDLAKILEFGAVPVKFGVSQVQTVSPTLGKDSLQAAILSGLLGVLLVILFFFFYYRMLTLVVVGGLAVSAGLLWSTIAFLSKTNGLALSLAGVAGIIVSIGVTIDSYVVFFERIKDELHKGKTIKNSAQRSFDAAWRTILAADTVSFIGALILWKLTVGSVRGFAFFLGLSTLCDVVVAYTFTRPAVLLLARSRFMAGRKVLGVVRQPEVTTGVAQ